ncbi:MAG: DEAD/DEAH box helicase [Sphingomonadales bacterium]|nr:DEAD/DEAH box helicase [Sphingomonadales bacterium]
MTTFKKLGLDPEILLALDKLGFETPTPVQAQAIPALLEENTDLVALAQTGTGKTAAFGLPVLQKLEFSGFTEGLILAPTRELCMQISRDLETYAAFKPSVSIVPVYGGASIRDQISLLKKGANVVVATPGRLIDLLERKAVHLDQIRVIVLDEADEMLNMGFQEDIDHILSHAPKERQTCLFSATMPPEVRSISKRYMHNPREISLAANTSNANIEHHYYVVREKHRYEAVKRILDVVPDVYGILFAQTRSLCQELAEKLIHDGYNADSLHGDLSQAQRDKVMGRFRNKNLNVLVATDVAARGIDVSDITHVINYSIPNELEVYTHRSGRTARAGKKGISISIIGQRDLQKIHRLEKITKAHFTQMQVPAGDDVVRAKFSHFVDELAAEEPDQQSIHAYLSIFYEKMKKITREELIEKLASLELRKFIEYYEGASDINDSSSGRRERGKEGGNGQFQKFFLSVGELDGFDKKIMLRWLNDCGLGNVDFGKIRIHRTHTFVEADQDSTQRIMDTLNKEKVNDRRVRVELQGMSEDGFTKRKKPGDKGKPGEYGKRDYYNKGKDGGGDKKKFKKRY